MNYKKQAFWYSLGIIFFRFSQWFILITLPKFFSLSESGIFSLAISVSSVFFLLSNFGVRQFQISDRYKRFSFYNYKNAIKILVLFAFLLMFFYFICFSYDLETSIVIISLCFFNYCYSLAEPYGGDLQLNDSLDVYGRAFLFSGIINIFVFCICYFLMHNFIICILALNILSGLFLLFYTKIYQKKIVKKHEIKINKKNSFFLIISLIPILFSSVCPLIINAYPKIFLSKKVSSELLGIFGIFSTFSMLIPDFAGTLFSPMPNILSKLKSENKVSILRKSVLKYILLIFMYDIICLSFVFIFGRLFFRLMYGDLILDNINIFYYSVFGILFYTFVVCLSSVLIIFEKKNFLMFSALLSLLSLICLHFIIRIGDLLLQESIILLLTYIFESLLILAGVFYCLFLSNENKQ